MRNYTYNYYDFGAMEVNPPKNKRTDYGFTGSKLRAPKKGDRKKWRNLYLFVMSRYNVYDELKPLMKQYNVTDEDIKKERFATKNKVIINKVESDRLRPLPNAIKFNALKEVSRVAILKKNIKFFKENNIPSHRFKNDVEELNKLTTKRKRERTIKNIKTIESNNSYEKLLEKDLKKRGLL